MIGTIIGWFFISLLFLLLLLLLLPVTVSLRFAEGAFTVRLRVLFLFFTVFPMKPVRPKPQKAKKTKQPRAKRAPEKKKEKPKKTFGEQVVLIKRLVRAGKAALGVVLRHLHIHAVDLFLPLQAAEPDQVARNCGTVQAGIGLVRALLENTPVHMRYKRLYVQPDFTGQFKGQLSFSCKVSLSPAIIVVAGFKGLGVFLAPIFHRAARLRRARAAARARAKAAARRPADA